MILTKKQSQKTQRKQMTVYLRREYNMDWETFSTKLIPWTLILIGITFVGGLLFGLVYR